MRKILKYAVCFGIGGTGYGIIELIYRRRTHWTMIIAGGVCFVLFSVIEKCARESALLVKAVLCSGAVTAVELIFGVVCNIILKMNIWDYKDQKFNLLGQICPKFSLIWGVLGIVFMPLAKLICERIDHQRGYIGSSHAAHC